MRKGVGCPGVPGMSTPGGPAESRLQVALESAGGEAAASQEHALGTGGIATAVIEGCRGRARTCPPPWVSLLIGGAYPQGLSPPRVLPVLQHLGLHVPAQPHVPSWP